MNISFKQIKGFIAVAEYENFTRAAEVIHLTQAGVSALIRDLELQLGFELFRRTTRKVILTSSGKAFLQTAKSVIDQLESSINKQNNEGYAKNKELIIGVTPLIAGYLMPDILLEFNSQCPDTRLVIREIERTAIRESVESEYIDAGFGAFFEVRSGIRRKKIISSQLMLALPMENTFSKESIHWSRLPSGSYIALPTDNPIQKKVMQKLQSINLKLDWTTTYAYIETVVGMVQKGHGYAILPGFAATITRSKSVRLIPITPEVSTDYYCISLAGKKLPSEFTILQTLFSKYFVKNEI